MSYEHGTPFVNLPQTVGSDKRDWMDTNEAFRDLDAKLKTAYEGAGSSAEGLVEVNARVDEVNTTVSQHTTQIEELTAHLGTTDENVAVNSTAINGLQTEVRDNKQDLKDSICSIEEQTATAQYRHEVGTYFWYNDTLYKTTVLIAVNQQIVPNVNCDTTNITAELLNGGSGGNVDANDVTFNNSGTDLSSTNAEDAIKEVNTKTDTKQDKTDNNLTTSNKQIVGAINELNSNMPNVNTLSNTYTFNAGTCMVNNAIFKSTSTVIVCQNANGTDFHSIMLSAKPSNGSVELTAYGADGSAYNGNAKLCMLVIN